MISANKISGVPFPFPFVPDIDNLIFILWHGPFSHDCEGGF